MSGGIFCKNAKWMNILGIVAIVLGAAAAVLALVLWFVVYPGGTFDLGRPNVWLYMIAWIGGGVAVALGILLLFVKCGCTAPAKVEQAAGAEHKIKCKSCGEIFTVSSTDGPIKCPACGATGKLE